MKSAVIDSSTPAAARKSWVSDLLELVKTRLTLLVLFTTLAGFYMGSTSPMNGLLLLHTLVGTGLVAASASALNQVLEREHDRRMARTADRPLAARRRHPDGVLIGATVVGIGGFVYLALLVNLLSSALAAATLASYVFLYTPLKRVTSLNTLVGAIPGALPPVIGYAAVRDQIGTGAIVLFAIMFFWQLPHFLAIAWMYRDEYRGAGFKMMSADDPGGVQTSRQALLTSAALLPIALLPTLLGLDGRVYFVGAFVLGLYLCWQAWRFQVKRDDASARRLFLASIIYLPLLLALMAYDAVR